ncbi:hypothetical protein QBC39DRAFT_376325 [Podospora conica]|nr:hypothetical protein QBC39DRAFT_376325 [Schizothecium conicum]
MDEAKGLNRQRTKPTVIKQQSICRKPRTCSPDKENSVEKRLRKGGELTTPEKNKTVEEWIYHKAGPAEQKLKEFETMVLRSEERAWTSCCARAGS